MDNRKELALRSTRFKFQVNWLVLGNNGGQSTKLASRGLSSRILPLQDSWTRTLQALQFLALPGVNGIWTLEWGSQGGLQASSQPLPEPLL